MVFVQDEEGRRRCKIICIVILQRHINIKYNVGNVETVWSDKYMDMTGSSSYFRDGNQISKICASSSTNYDSHLRPYCTYPENFNSSITLFFRGI
jgi:bisphosphoglycerate-dependent phosphoglycerate mutase